MSLNQWGTRDFKRRSGAPRGELADRKAGARFAQRELTELRLCGAPLPLLGAKTTLPRGAPSK